jgi:hypothetical protein
MFSPKPDISPDRRWRNPMKILIRVTYMALSLTFGIPPVANAGDNAPAPVQQNDTASWANG